MKRKKFVEEMSVLNMLMLKQNRKSDMYIVTWHMICGMSYAVDCYMRWYMSREKEIQAIIRNENLVKELHH
jgi:hypothetical protein